MLVKYRPNYSTERGLGLFDRAFDDMFGLNRAWRQEGFKIVPAVNIEENENEYQLSAELPGLSKDDINIEFRDNTLTISGEKKSEREDKNNNYHLYERSYGKFYRAFEIDGADGDKINAEYKNGVLNIVIPKAEEAKPKQIEVKVK